MTDGLVRPLIAEGHTVACTLTPEAHRWAEASGQSGELAELTGLPVRGMSRLPTDSRPHPRIDVFVMAPASANSVAKLALGLGDNQALTTLCEGMGTTPVVLFPRVNAAHVRHPAWSRHLEALTSAGVRIIFGEDIWPLYEPRQGDPNRRIPWSAILAAIRDSLNA